MTNLLLPTPEKEKVTNASQRWLREKRPVVSVKEAQAMRPPSIFT